VVDMLRCFIWLTETKSKGDEKIMGYDYVVENIDDGNTVIWETGSRDNKILWDSNNIDNLQIYKRRDLSNYEIVLRDNDFDEYANKIKEYLGKIIRYKQYSNDIIPDGNYETTVSLNYLKMTIEEYVKEYNLNLDPDFQRGHVWTKGMRVKYVEFVLRGGKSNPIYFNHEGWMSDFRGEFVLVDGKQRLTSLLMFLNNEFPVFKEKDTEDNIGFYAKEFECFNNSVTFIINKLPDKKSVLKWYLQMNEANIAHSDEELNKVREMIKKEDI